MNIEYNHNHINNEYKSFVINRFLDKSKFDSDDIYRHQDILENNLYSLTAHFKNSTKTSNIDQQIYVMDCFRSYYMDLSAAIIDKDPRKRKKLQPLIHVSFDVEGGRARKFVSNPEIPHLHGIALIHPQTKEHFERALDSGIISKSIDGMTECVKYEKVSYTNKAMNKIATYCLKYTSVLKGNNVNYSPNDFFPLLPPAKYPFYKWNPRDGFVN